MKRTIRTALNKNIILFTAVIALLLGYFTYFTVLRLTFKIAESIAHESSNVISTEINAIINREIYITLNLAESSLVSSWLKDEGSPEKEAAVLTELSQYLDDMRDHNIFLASETSKNFYFIEDNMPEVFEPIYMLDEALDNDAWYFKTRDLIQDYDLNVDVDRSLKTIRIWININVRDGDDFLGIVGTGIELNPILENIFAREEHYNSESLIFDAFGAIQLIREFDKIQENSFGETEASKSIFAYSDSDTFKSEILAFIENPSRNQVIELDRNRQFMILSPIENTDWFMATYYNTREIVSLSDFLPLIAMTFGLFITFILGINKIVKGKVITPIERLNSSLLKDDPYGLDRQDEIGNLSNTIIKMNQQLRKYSRELEDKYQMQSDLLNNFLDKAPVGVVQMDHKTRILSSNLHFKTMTQANDPLHLRNLLIEEVDIIKSLETNNNLTIRCSIRGMEKWFELQNLSNDCCEDIIDLLITDITDKKQHEMELERIASIDPLTGIYNRRQFEKLANKEIYNLRRYGIALSMIMFDIDHFKAINDQYGHPVGDDILQSLARLVESVIRASDHFARWGGEEFVLLLSHTNLDKAKLKAEEIRLLIEAYHFGIDGGITASFGVAEFTRYVDYEDVFKQADTNLYLAKDKGRNQVVG